MDTSGSTLSLVAAFAATYYLILRCYTPPNPAPEASQRWTGDSMDRVTQNRQRIIDFFSTAYIYHMLLILRAPSSPSALCPHPENLDPKLFTWSVYTVSYIALMCVAATVRLLAYTQLGQNFTYELAKPQRLVKTGLYAYMRHPSYPPLFVTHVVIAALVLRARGAAGCFAPTWAVRMTFLGVATDVWVLGFAGVLVINVLAHRVSDEEEMLRKSVGKEYEEYAKHTKKFIPWVY